MELALTGKTALILAASKGLGKAIATGLANEGADIVIGSRNKDALEEAAKEIQSTAKGQVMAVPVDVTGSKAMENIIEKTANRFGKIDILVNNAGGPPFGKFES